MTKVIRVERMRPPPGAKSEPFLTPHGYKIAHKKYGNDRHNAEFKHFARDLDELALRVGEGWSVWFKQDSKRETLISPKSIRILRS